MSRSHAVHWLLSLIVLATLSASHVTSAANDIEKIICTERQVERSTAVIVNPDGTHPVLLGDLLSAPETTQPEIGLSPDGRSLALSDGRDIWIRPLDRSDAHKLTKHDSNDQAGRPAWSPDGKQIAYAMFHADRAWLSILQADGSAERELISVEKLNFGDPTSGARPTWSPDGKQIAAMTSQNKLSIITAANGTRREIDLSAFTVYASAVVAWSPDGKTLAIGSPGVFLLLNGDGSSPRLLSQASYSALAWSPDGKRLAAAHEGGYALMNADGSPIQEVQIAGHSCQSIVWGRLARDLYANLPNGDDANVTVNPTLNPIANPPILVEAESGSVMRTGDWVLQPAARASGGVYVYGTTGSLSTVLSGTAIEVIYVRHPAFGTFALEIDGDVLQEVDAKSETSEFNLSIRVVGLSPGTHQVKVYPLKGTIAIDALRGLNP